MQTVIIAFSMFSHIPMPSISWNQRNMRYVLCAFPLVGLAIGGSVFLWVMLADVLQLGAPLFGAGLTVLPVLLTGGIHMDGFLDTADALASHSSSEKKLEIMKDPHTGAFAVIAAACYFILYYSLSCTLWPNMENILCLTIGYVLCRAYSGLAAAVFPCAKDSGLAHTFSDLAAKKAVRLFLGGLIAVLWCLLIIAHHYYGIGIILVTVCLMAYYWRMSQKNFGGITGDVSGYFLQLCEIAVLAAIVLVQKGMEAGGI